MAEFARRSRVLQRQTNRKSDVLRQGSAQLEIYFLDSRFAPCILWRLSYFLMWHKAATRLAVPQSFSEATLKLLDPWGNSISKEQKCEL